LALVASQLAVALEQSPPFFVGLAPRLALDFDPVGLLARSVGGHLGVSRLFPQGPSDRPRQLTLGCRRKFPSSAASWHFEARIKNVLLPEIVSRSLLSLRGDAGANDPVFASRKGGGRLTQQDVGAMVKRAAKKAGITEAVSPHWLRHAHGSHAIERGASLPEVQATLGHGNIATTSGYLHARPDSSSGLRLDPGVFLR
jgi:Phage integrase family